MSTNREFDGHPIDRDRLFSPCILNYGMHRAIMRSDTTASFLVRMTSEQRLEWLEFFPPAGTEAQQRMRQVAREAIAEVEAWECIERVRRMSKKPGRKVRSKGGAA